MTIYDVLSLVLPSLGCYVLSRKKKYKSASQKRRAFLKLCDININIIFVTRNLTQYEWSGHPFSKQKSKLSNNIWVSTPHLCKLRIEAEWYNVAVIHFWIYFEGCRTGFLFSTVCHSFKSCMHCASPPYG